MDGLHVILGVVVQFAAAIVLRTDVSKWRPWLAVLVLTIANEIYDLAFEQWPHPGMQYGEAAKDLLLTMALPTLLLFCARWRPSVLRRP